MKIGDHSCGLGCPKQNVCLKPDRKEADIGNSSNGSDPLISILWDIQPPNLRCIYDLDKIDTPSQVNALKKLFPNEQVNHVMRAFCTQKSTKCPDNRSGCSRLLDLDESGSMCREWLATLPSDEARDSVRREYCIHNDTDDCKCINRTKHQDFNDLRNGMDAGMISSTRCWYKPCEDNSNLLLDVEQKQECIENVCQNIIDAHAEGNINISNNTSSLSCNFSRKQLADAEAKRAAKLTPPTPVPPQTNPSFSILDFLGQHKISVGVVVLFVVLLVFALNR